MYFELGILYEKSQILRSLAKQIQKNSASEEVTLFIDQYLKMDEVIQDMVNTALTKKDKES